MYPFFFFNFLIKIINKKNQLQDISKYITQYSYLNSNLIIDKFLFFIYC